MEWEQLTDYSQPVGGVEDGSGLLGSRAVNQIGDYVIVEALSQSGTYGFRL